MPPASPKHRLPRLIVLSTLLPPHWSEAEDGPAQPNRPRITAPVMEPLWEIGLFNFVASLPLYRGSDEARFYAFPLPYLIFRGERIRFRIAGDLVFGHRDYNGYFYDVDPAHAIEERPAYRASGGFGGTSLSLSGQYDLPR